MPLDDRGEREPGRERSVGASALAAEAGRAERVGDGRVAVADEQRALEAEGEPFDEPPRAQLGVGGVGELAAQVGDGGVEPRVGAGGEVDLGEQRVEALGLARDRAEDVERVDVAGALPDAS